MAHDTEPQPKKPKVLVIEDDNLMRTVLRHVLEAADYVAVEASNGVEGMETFWREKPDIVITDIQMPDKGGLEIISEIRALNPGVRIIAMSGGAGTGNLHFLAIAKRFGADHALSKPFSPEDILGLLKKCSSPD
jgi:two-component system, chemotaxis family, chemotaxis protein CheY